MPTLIINSINIVLVIVWLARPFAFSMCRVGMLIIKSLCMLSILTFDKQAEVVVWFKNALRNDRVSCFDLI